MSDTKSPAISEALKIKSTCMVQSIMMINYILSCYLRARKLGQTMLSIILVWSGGFPETESINITNTETDGWWGWDNFLHSEIDSPPTAALIWKIMFLLMKTLACSWCELWALAPVQYNCLRSRVHWCIEWCVVCGEWWVVSGVLVAIFQYFVFW